MAKRRDEPPTDIEPREWGGVDAPVFGPMITEKFKGQRKDHQRGWVDVEVEVTYPEYCAVTVYRIVGGQRCGFTEPVWWKEFYGRVGDSSLPNDMWAKRPKGELVKLAKAFSLRVAFPEEARRRAAASLERRVQRMLAK